MALTHGVQGNVHASTVNSADLLSNLVGTNSSNAGAVAVPYQWSFDVQGASAEVGGFGEDFNSSAAGPAQWSATINARYPAGGPRLGAQAQFSADGNGDNEYTANVTAFNLTLQAASFGPEFIFSTGSGETQWAEFAAGQVNANGTFDAILDDTAALALADSAGSALSTATFLLTRATTNDNSISIPIVQTGPNVTSAFNDFNRIQYSFVSSGAITGQGDENLIGASTLARPAINGYTFQADSGITYTGDAFWTSVAISVSPDSAIDIVAQVQGTGPLSVD